MGYLLVKLIFLFFLRNLVTNFNIRGWALKIIDFGWIRKKCPLLGGVLEGWVKSKKQII